MKWTFGMYVWNCLECKEVRKEKSSFLEYMNITSSLYYSFKIWHYSFINNRSWWPIFVFRFIRTTNWNGMWDWIYSSKLKLDCRTWNLRKMIQSHKPCEQTSHSFLAWIYCNCWRILCSLVSMNFSHSESQSRFFFFFLGFTWLLVDYSLHIIWFP